MTVSIGVTMISPSDDRPEAVLERVDEALYQAKGLGRDRYQTKLAAIVHRPDQVEGDRNRPPGHDAT